MTFRLTSSAFDHGGHIPDVYTCEGANQVPPLQWEGVPSQAQSLVLIVDDPDAPNPRAPKMTWVHWLVYNIPPSVTGIPEGAVRQDLPKGAEEGINDWKRASYDGPCPPIGRHRYFHKLYALDTVLKGLSKPDKKTLEGAMAGHILAQAELIGTYEKSR